MQFDARETPSVKLGDSDGVRVGDTVYSLGSPLGIPETTAYGNISNPSWRLGERHFIQFTAPISPGSSGGGLFNQHGEVVGITAAVVSEPQAENLNLAVPINDLKAVLENATVPPLFKESPGYYYSIGNLADNKERWDEAIGYYQKALAIDTDYADAYLGLGGDYYEKGEYDLEVKNYGQAAKLEPNNKQAFYYLGTAFEDIDQFDNAIAAYQRALTVDPKYKDALHDLAIVYLAQGRVEEAQELLPRLVAADKGWANEVSKLMGRIAKSTGNGLSRSSPEPN